MNMTQTLQYANQSTMQHGPQEMWNPYHKPAAGQSHATNLVDCHLAEHLLVGTHQPNGSASPRCLTCQLRSAA